MDLVWKALWAETIPSTFLTGVNFIFFDLCGASIAIRHLILQRGFSIHPAYHAQLGVSCDPGGGGTGGKGVLVLHELSAQRIPAVPSSRRKDRLIVSNVITTSRSHSLSTAR